jgi:hypothetical protein
MKKTMIIAGFLVVAAFPAMVKADTASGTLTVTGTVASSITLTVESAGGTFTQGGTSAASTDLGSVSKYGAAPTGFTKTTSSTDWTLSSSVGVKVVKANLASATYILNAKLATAPAGGVAWSLNGFPLNGSTDVAMTAVGTYGATPTYAWTIVIPDTVAATSAIDNVIQLSAISN